MSPQVVAKSVWNMQRTALTIYVGGNWGGIGLSLHGTCSGSAEATQLLQAVRQVLLRGTITTLWLDCQHLAAISSEGQQTMLQLEREAQQAGLRLYWCNFNEQVAQQLSDTGLHLLLRTQPAATYPAPLGSLDRSSLGYAS